MMPDTDIVMFALPRWDGTFYSTALSLSKELSKTNRVFYVDNPFTLKYTLTKFFTKPIQRRWKALFFGADRYRLIESENPNLINVTPMIIFPINFLPAGKLYNFFSRVNDFIVRRSLNAAVRDYKIQKFIFINSYNPFFFQDLGKLKPWLKVYHCVDSISESNYVAKHGRALEESLIRKSDLTLTTSLRLTDYAKQFSPNVVCLPNAADFSLFQTALNPNVKRPAEIAHVTKKIVGYIGNVDYRSDYEILNAIVDENPEWVLLLVGPTGEDFVSSGLSKKANVISTGSKPLIELPAYVKYMNCGIIPFKLNKLTESIYPLKLNEYLAAGVPVVTTAFSPDLADFKDVITIAGTKKEFIASLKVEIEGDSAEKKASRTSKASKNTWPARVLQFWNIVENLTAKR